MGSTGESITIYTQIKLHSLTAYLNIESNFHLRFQTCYGGKDTDKVEYKDKVEDKDKDNDEENDMFLTFVSSVSPLICMSSMYLSSSIYYMSPVSSVYSMSPITSMSYASLTRIQM